MGAMRGAPGGAVRSAGTGIKQQIVAGFERRASGPGAVILGDRRPVGSGGILPGVAVCFERRTGLGASETEKGGSWIRLVRWLRCLSALLGGCLAKSWVAALLGR